MPFANARNGTAVESSAGDRQNSDQKHFRTHFMDYLMPLALGLAAIGLFVALRYHQAYKRRMELQRKRRLQARPPEPVTE
jgi:hypothetical protein